MISKQGLTGPRFIEPHQTSKISEKSMVRYREALQEFTTWALDHSYYPETQEEYDDLLAEFCHEHPDLTRSKFGNTVAARGVLLPSSEGEVVLGSRHSVRVGCGAIDPPYGSARKRLSPPPRLSLLRMGTLTHRHRSCPPVVHRVEAFGTPQTPLGRPTLSRRRRVHS